MLTLNPKMLLDRSVMALGYSCWGLFRRSLFRGSVFPHGPMHSAKVAGMPSFPIGMTNLQSRISPPVGILEILGMFRAEEHSSWFPVP